MNLKLCKEMKNFHFVPVMFRDDTWQGEKGIIDRAKIEKVLSEYGFDINSCGYYICGPAILTNVVLSSLQAMGVNKKNIHFEKFSM